MVTTMTSLRSANREYEYKKQCERLDAMGKGEYGLRRNTIVLCNNGFQRSLPFLCYYLVNYHSDEVPDLDKALDIILPQVSKEAYSEKNTYLERIGRLSIFN